MSTNEQSIVLPALRTTRDGLRLLSRAGVYLAVGALRYQQLRALAASRPIPVDLDACAVDDGLEPHETELYGRWIPPASRVFLAGAGAGRRLVGLARLGHDVSGIDRSSSAVSAANEHAARCRLPCAVRYAAAESDAPDGPFDVVVVSARCYSGILTTDLRRATLARMAAALRPGGRLIVHYIPHAQPSSGARLLQQAAAWLSGADRRPEPGDMFELADAGVPAVRFQRTFRDGELEQEAGTAGLRLVHEEPAEHQAAAVFERWIDVRDSQVDHGSVAGARRVLTAASRVERACLGLATAFDAAAVGLVRDAALERLLDQQFAGFEDSAAAVDRGLFASERQVYARHRDPSSRVLLVGCGAGRDLFGLAALGHEVSGLECAPDLVEAARAHARRRGVACAIACGRVQDAPIAGTFDAIILAPVCYSYIRGRATRIRTLERLRRAICPDGRVIVHVSRQQRPPQRLPLAVMRAAARVSRAGWRPEPGDVYTDDRRLPKRLHFYHAFADGEFDGEARSAGLVPEAVYPSAARAECVVLRVPGADRHTEERRIQL